MLRIIVLYFIFFMSACAFAGFEDDQFKREFDEDVSNARALTNAQILSEFLYRANNIDQSSPFTFVLTTTPLLTVLNERSEVGDLEASFYSVGIMKRKTCEKMLNNKLEISDEFCAEMVSDLKKIANKKSQKYGYFVASANMVLGDLYKEGRAVKKSNILATEWYYKSGSEYMSNGFREEAVRAYEEASNLTRGYKPSLD